VATPFIPVATAIITVIVIISIPPATVFAPPAMARPNTALTPAIPIAPASAAIAVPDHRAVMAVTTPTIPTAAVRVCWNRQGCKQGH
jgi:hypothetical protein